MPAVDQSFHRTRKQPRSAELQMTQPPWKATYADLNATSFGDASQEIIIMIPKLPFGDKVLDLGCGDGRNAIPLA